MPSLPILPSLFGAPYVTLLLLTTLVFIPRFANAQGNDPNRYIPPPLREHEWVDKSNLNYTELHNKYSEVLTCLFIPTGVLGYFWWFSTSLMNVICVAKCMVILLQEKRLEENREKSTLVSSLICGVFTLGWSTYSIIAGLKTLNSCSDLSGFSAVRTYIIMNVVAGISSAIGSILYTCTSFEPVTIFLGSAAVFHSIALHVQYLSGLVLFFSVAKSAGILGKIIKKPDLVRVGATIACVIPSEIFVLPIAVALIFATGPIAFVTVPLAVVAFAMCATSNVLLGKILGDPAGKYLLGVVWGKFTASMTALGPILEVVLFGLGQAFL